MLGQFGKIRMSIGYYIDALTVSMFCMVTLIASCIHFYATGYMHDELHDFTDPEVTMSDGSKLTRQVDIIGSSRLCRCSASVCSGWSSLVTWR